MDNDHTKSTEALEKELAEARARIRELEQRIAPDSAEQLGNDVFEHHRHAVFYLDPSNGDIRWVNLAATELYGYTREEMTSLNVSDINIMPLEEVAPLMKQVRDRQRSRFLFTHRLKDGRLRNVEVYSVPMTLEGRDMLCSFVRDVTDMMDVQTVAEKSEAMQNSVLSSMNLVPFSMRKSGSYELLYIGATVERMTGYPAERYYREPELWLSRIHPDDIGRVGSQFRRLEKEGASRCDFRWQVADDSWRWFSLNMRHAPCEDGNEDCICVMGLCWDITQRKRVEKKLLEREERYRTIADFTHDWEFWLGPEGTFLYVSPSFERMTGYRPEELKADPDLLFNSIIHPMDRDYVHNALIDGLHSTDTLSFDFRIVTRSGEVRWIGHVSQVVYDDKGDPMGRRASNRDITGLKETVQALKDRNKFIDSFMENCPATIYAKDVDGRYLFGNPRFMEYTGRPAHEVLGKTDYGLFRNNIAEQFRSGDTRVVQTGKPFFEEVTLVLESGIEHWTSSKFPLVNAEGRTLGVCGISMDVTKWRETEVSLRQMTHAVEQSPVSIAMLDTAGRIISVNPYFCTKSGYTEKDILGRKLGFLQADEDDLYDRIWKQVREGRDWHGEIRNRTRSGDILWERCSISSVRDPNGHIVNFVVVKDDITERKRLERLEKDVERIVRHDLKSPIMSFIWVPRSLRKAENITEEQSLMLADMEESAHRLLRMVNLSLDIFKMEEGSYEFSPEDLNIMRVIQNVLRDLAGATRSLKVEINVLRDGTSASDGECMVVRGEELLTHSMLSNLIKNAVEASDKGDTVTVDCRQDKENTTVRVHNRAEVPEDIRDTFFEKYATSGKKFGTGLGTYSARLIAETQGGFINMKSDAENGTTVEVSFPTRSNGACD
ncbi:PAS domain-containing sensor histidine kinase [Pseudodesulfovibrio sp. zrk46]|uniref:PAS domain-containing protein n=1 Tax=Pseudodesulfovibrio sp. zrk46 TaxID=2725288 RepID=UPI0014496EBF|nr:PAS domain-containing sensor histidine kinase [Pseudodesulfovibrio sp. zrk46]QJB56139.1 PAS domain S-box protein [Pseudodesulfovibrio sp. zrk46]